MLKYKNRSSTITVLKDLAKAKKSKQYLNSVEYINCKNRIEEIYSDIAEGIKVRSR